MIIPNIELEWAAFRQKIFNWRNKRRNDRLIKVNAADERSISLLQKRYGYTREKATTELNKHYSKAWLG